MKTRMVELYEYSELSEKAKRRALDDYRKATYEIGCYFADVVAESMQKYACNLNCKLYDYHDWYYARLYREWVNGRDLTGVRAYKYIVNNCRLPDEKSRNFDDWIFADVLAEFVKRLRKKPDAYDLDDFLDMMCLAYKDAYDDEWEHALSEEECEQQSVDNEIWFFKNGEVFNECNAA